MLKLKTLFSLLLLFLLKSAYAQTEIIRGLTVVVEFTNAPFTNSLDSVSKMMNQPGFQGWGNEGSVRDYFLAMSAGKLDISSSVIKVSLPNPVEHYYDGGPGNDLSDIIDQINIHYPDGFQNLTISPDGSVKHFHILCKASRGAWAFGGQPGSNKIKNNGQDVFITNGNITTYGINQNPEYNTICHEMGHNVMGWPDHYQTAWNNLGNYCVMASAGSNKGPMPINPGLRYEKGWIDNVIEVGNTTQTYTAVSNSYNTIYKYTNPYNSKEYLLIHPQVYGGYYQQYQGGNNIADQGLAIYYVDEDGGMDLSGYELEYIAKLIQADNRDELHDEDRKHIDVRGDFDDLFDNLTPAFDNSTIFRWKDGGEFGILINNISAPGATMSFTVNARPATFIATTDKNGTISPSGVISAAAGSSRTFTFTPYPGYEINQVKVDNAAVSITGNTYTVLAGGTKRIEVSYKRKTTLDALPAPWQHADIGNTSISGVSGQANNKYYLESYGGDIWGNYDNFRFVYQTLNGDGSIEAKLTFANKPHFWSKAGIMIRESLNPNSAYSMLMYTPRNHTRVQQRTSTDGYATDNPNNVKDLHFYNLYKWLKITRQGNVITSYCSRDRVNWVQMGQQTISMGSQVYIGMAVTGALSDYPVRAQFDSITVVKSNIVCTDPEWNPSTAYNGGAKVSYNGRKYTAQWWNQNSRPDLNSGAGKPWADNGPCGTVNQAPVVTLTSPANGNAFIAPAIITLSANASDPDGTISKVEFYSENTLIGYAFSSPFTYSWIHVPAGNYAITAKAYDNNDLTTTSTVAHIQVTENTPCSASAYSSTTAYNSGAIVSYSGIKYVSNWWTLNERPDLNNGPTGSGKPWTSLGTCNSKMGAFSQNTISSIYPNPTSGAFSIVSETETSAQILNSYGNEVTSINLTEGINNLNLSLPAGIYIIKTNSSITKLRVE